jgi:hypothetical protein
MSEMVTCQVPVGARTLVGTMPSRAHGGWLWEVVAPPEVAVEIGGAPDLLAESQQACGGAPPVLVYATATAAGQFRVGFVERQPFDLGNRPLEIDLTLIAFDPVAENPPTR